MAANDKTIISAGDMPIQAQPIHLFSVVSATVVAVKGPRSGDAWGLAAHLCSSK